jgi:hypothetical protein
MWGMRVLVFVLAVLVGGCGGDPAPLQAEIDGLDLPATWQVAKTVVQSGASGCVTFDNPYCPSVTRYFVVSGDLPDVFQQAKGAIVKEGFGKLEEAFPHCDLNTDGPPCSMNATKGALRMEVDLYRPGKDVDSLGVSTADHATVRIVVR